MVELTVHLLDGTEDVARSLVIARVDLVDVGIWVGDNQSACEKFSVGIRLCVGDAPVLGSASRNEYRMCVSADVSILLGWKFLPSEYTPL